jgi:hypothetical protein
MAPVVGEINAISPPLFGLPLATAIGSQPLVVLPLPKE